MHRTHQTRWASWIRPAGLLVTAALFYLIFQKVDVEVLAKTLAQADLGWILVGLALYGLTLFLAGLRWHLSLRLTQCTVHANASLRLAYIGHFFYVLLFGAAGGDVAKSLLYARWFRYPLPEVLAAAPIDRVIGSAGAIMVVPITLLMSAFAGGFSNLNGLTWTWNGGVWFFLAALAIAGVLGLLMWEPRGENPWIRGFTAMRQGLSRFLRVPHFAGKGLLCAFLHQLANYGVFAICLLSLTQTGLPWLALAWTLPAITILSCFPVSFAGAGVRELAAVTLLGLYGVPPGDSVAAAVLTLFIRLFWAACGGILLWRESKRQRQRQNRSEPKTISVVIPTLDEAEVLPETLARLQAIPEILEVIVVDGSATAATRHVAQRLGCRVLQSPPSRGRQLRLGATQAQGDIVLLLHADTWLPPQAGKSILNTLRDRTVAGGGFWKIFHQPPFFLLGSRWKCALRLWFSHRLMGDQAIFARREVLEHVGGVPDIPLMEEFALCDRLKTQGKLALAGSNILTSARRFRKHGPLQTYLLMGWVHLLYRLGCPTDELQRIYEQGKLSLPQNRAGG